MEMQLTDQKKLAAEEGEEEPHTLMSPRRPRRSSTPSGVRVGRGPSFLVDALGLEENIILMKTVNDLTISSVRDV